jgi:chromosome segregation ATPase
MPLKNWPPTDDWPPKDPPRSSHEDLAKDERFQALTKRDGPEAAALEEVRNLLRESYREIEGMKEASREAREGSAAAVDVVQAVESQLGSLRQRVNDMQATLDAATQRRDEFVQDTARIENDGRSLAATIVTHVERLAVEKSRFEEFERRMDVLLERERQLAYLPQRLEDFSRTFQALTEQSNELRSRQASLEPLQERIAQLERRHEELAQKSDELAQKMKALADGESVISAVKEALDTVHQMSARSKADLQYISDHREDLALLRSRLEELLTLTGAAEQKIRRIF